MPPAAFIAAATCSFSTSPTTGNAVLTFLTPATTKPGDTLLIAVMSIDSTDGAVDTSRMPSGWSVVATYGPTQLGQIATVVRRLATDTEPPSHAVALAGLAIAGGALLVYRGLDGGAAVVDGGIADVDISPAFPCPSLTLTTYSDLYVGIAWVSNGSVPVTPPSGTTERLDVAQAPFGAPCELAAFELLKEATGPTGAQTATTIPLHSGIAAAVALKTLPPFPAPAITADIPGAIGFVTVGV
jgi:hypothetical protein